MFDGFEAMAPNFDSSLTSSCCSAVEYHIRSDFLARFRLAPLLVLRASTSDLARLYPFSEMTEIRHATVLTGKMCLLRKIRQVAQNGSVDN